MSGLLGSLLNNYQALNAQSQALDTTGKNLANINNPGYARQRVVLGSLGSITMSDGSTQSMGTTSLGLQQARDVLLDRQLQRDISQTAYLDASQSGLQAAESALGQQLNRLDDTGSVSSTTTSTGAGINENLSTFFAGFDALSLNPSDTGEKQLLIQKAGILAEKINTSDSRLAQVQTDLTDQVTADVTKVNDLITSISELNISIGRAENIKPDSAVDLRDERQAQIEELAKYMDVSVVNVAGTSGQVRLSAGGVTIIDPTLVPQITNLVTFAGSTFSAGVGPAALALTSGSLKARIDVRDGQVTDTRTDLKALADQLRISVNALSLNSAGGFFAAVPSAGHLIDLDPTLTTTTLQATNTGTSGGNEQAVLAANLASKIFTTPGDKIDGTFSAHFSGMVATLGLNLSNTTNRLDDQTLNETLTRQNRDSVSGVSQDEELANMLRFQRCYQASARFTNAIDGLLDLVVNRLGSF